MSSGRDVMLENWSQEQKQTVFKPLTHLERMYKYRKALQAYLEQLEYHIKELEDEQTKTI